MNFHVHAFSILIQHNKLNQKELNLWKVLHSPLVTKNKLQLQNSEDIRN
jgi:hypothetical protein